MPNVQVIKILIYEIRISLLHNYKNEPINVSIFGIKLSKSKIEEIN